MAAHNNLLNYKKTGSPVFHSVVVLIALVLLSWFLLRPMLSNAFDSRSKVKAAKQKLDTLENDQRELNRLVNQMKSSPDEVALVDEALPLTGRVSRVYVLLDNMVRSSGMTLSVLSSDDTTSIISAGDKSLLQDPYQPGRTLHTMSITASVSGTMEQLRNLLQLMETNGRVLDVVSMEIIGGEPVTRFVLKVNAYAYEKTSDQVPLE